MVVPPYIDGLEQARILPGSPVHLAIGMFDGVHLGHRAVIEAAVVAAREVGGVAAVLTFWPHPSHLFRPQEATRLISSPEAKLRQLAALGVDTVVVQSFTPAFAEIEAEAFVPHLLACIPGLTTLYVGENWRFGRGRRGDIDFLRREANARGVAVVSAPRVQADGAPVSSSRIRALLAAGDVGAAGDLLGYRYFAEGRVASGKRLGRTIGFPTLNLDWQPELRPLFGVYVVRISGPKAPDGLPGVANYGLRPTVETALVPKLETHVLGDRCPFGEGDPIRVEWLHLLRPERRFSGLDALRAQIARDTEAGEAWWSARA